MRDLLNSGAEGAYRCVYVNVEVGQVGREDVGRAMRAVLVELAREAKSTLGDESLASIWPGVLDTVGPDVALGEVLARWCEAGPVRLILLIDEIDALVGDSLLAVLQQLRTGYSQRLDRATGAIADEYLISVSADRRGWSRIDFSSLDRVDPVEALTRFNLRRRMTRTGVFTAIEPFTVSSAI